MNAKSLSFPEPSCPSSPSISLRALRNRLGRRKSSRAGVTTENNLKPSTAVVEIVDGSGDRLPDHSCGAGLYLVRARRLSSGSLPGRTFDVRDGVSCPSCGVELWEPRSVLRDEPDLVVWLVCNSLEELRVIESLHSGIKSFDEMEREAIEAEARFEAYLQANESTTEGDRNE